MACGLTTGPQCVVSGLISAESRRVSLAFPAPSSPIRVRAAWVWLLQHGWASQTRFAQNLRVLDWPWRPALVHSEQVGSDVFAVVDPCHVAQRLEFLEDSFARCPGFWTRSAEASHPGPNRQMVSAGGFGRYSGGVRSHDGYCESCESSWTAAGG